MDFPIYLNVLWNFYRIKLHDPSKVFVTSKMSCKNNQKIINDCKLKKKYLHLFSFKFQNDLG